MEQPARIKIEERNRRTTGTNVMPCGTLMNAKTSETITLSASIIRPSINKPGGAEIGLVRFIQVLLPASVKQN
jgi:hypothetical protein